MFPLSVLPNAEAGHAGSRSLPCVVIALLHLASLTRLLLLLSPRAAFYRYGFIVGFSDQSHSIAAYAAW